MSNYSDYELTYYEVELAPSNSNTEEEFLDLIDHYSIFADAHEAYNYGVTEEIYATGNFFGYTNSSFPYGVPSYTINIPNSGGQDL